VPDSPKVLFEITFHFYSHPVLEQLIFLGEELWGQLPQALLGKFAVGGAAKVHFGINQPMPAFFAETGGFILKKFYRMVANGAGNLKDRSRLPVAAVLSRASHRFPPKTFATELTENTEQ
jgi:hypothetical protein